MSSTQPLLIQALFLKTYLFQKLKVQVMLETPSKRKTCTLILTTWLEMDNQDRETIRSKEPLTQQMDKKHSEEKEIAKNSEMIELNLKVRMKKE